MLLCRGASYVDHRQGYMSIGNRSSRNWVVLYMTSPDALSVVWQASGPRHLLSRAILHTSPYLHSSPPHPCLVNCESCSIVAHQCDRGVEQVELKQANEACARLDDSNEIWLEELVSILQQRHQIFSSPKCNPHGPLKCQPDLNYILDDPSHSPFTRLTRKYLAVRNQEYALQSWTPSS